jgi:undecaprenyl-diphosphatase
MEWLESLVLGAVQGVTEFLPVSSDGHLSITQQAFAWLTGSGRSGAENLFFDVMLHVGTVAAIVAYYRAVWTTGLKGLLGSESVPPAYRRAAVVRTGLLAAVATTPLIPLALFLKKWIDKAFESTAAAGVGFLITAAVLLLTTWLQRRDEGGKGPAETTWLDALLIGVAQMFAPLPGVSRSGLTVAAALGLGLSRAWAVGFSLLIAVPAIVGAAVFEVKKLDPNTLTGDRVAQTAAAAAVAGVVGYGAIIWLVKVVRSGRLWYFSVYLVVLGLVVLAASAAGSRTPPPSPGATPDARRENAADGSVRGVGPRSPAARGVLRAVGPLAGPLADGEGTGPGNAGAVGGSGPGAEGLVLGGPLALRR